MRRLTTSTYEAAARRRLGTAVAAAREAAGYESRAALAQAADVGSRSIDKLEQGEPGVGQRVLHAVAHVLPGWDIGTPHTILEGGPIPPVTTAEPAVPEQRPTEQTPPDLFDMILHLRRQLSKDDFALMWRLFAVLNESNARFDEAEAAKARAEEEVRPDNPARVAAG